MPQSQQLSLSLFLPHSLHGWPRCTRRGYDDDWHQDVRLDDAYAQQAFRAGGALGTLGEREEEDVERLQQAYSPRGGPVVGDTGYLAERLYHAGSDSD